MMTALRIVGDRVLLDDEFRPGTITISGDTILSTTAASDDQAVASDDQAGAIDARGLIVGPGFIDTQINGGYGHDLTTDPGSMWQLGPKLTRHGVTAFLPTIISSPSSGTDAAIDALDRRPPDYVGAEPLGLHFEGPMLSTLRPGAHPIAHLLDPNLDMVARWSRDAGVALVTIAPELPAATTVITALAQRDVTVAAGHTEATADDAEIAIGAGVTMVTHLFNAMAPLGHREPNLAGVALADHRLAVGLIADGVHVDPLVIATIWKAKGPTGLALVTDAVAPMGLGPGRYKLAESTICADDRSARTKDGVLAGSILTMDQAVRNLIRFTNCEVREALATVTTTPARLIDEPSLARLEAGARADLVLLDTDLNVQITICGGRIAYVADGARRRIAAEQRRID